MICDQLYPESESMDMPKGIERRGAIPAAFHISVSLHAKYIPTVEKILIF